MGYFRVLKPCLVGGLHYVSIPVDPIEVDDVVAEPLVADGCLVSYSAGGGQPVRRPRPGKVPE